MPRTWIISAPTTQEMAARAGLLIEKLVTGKCRTVLGMYGRLEMRIPAPVIEARSQMQMVTRVGYTLPVVSMRSVPVLTWGAKRRQLNKEMEELLGL